MSLFLGVVAGDAVGAAVPEVVVCQGAAAERWKQLMGRSQGQSGNQNVSWLKSLVICKDCYEQ